MPIVTVTFFSLMGLLVFNYGSIFIFNLGGGVFMLSLGILICLYAYKVFRGLRGGI